MKTLANTTKIDGYDISNWFRSGFQEVNSYKQHLNAINIFPVADGDTGTNLTATLRAMVEKSKTEKAFGSMFKNISESGLAHARGNSGIIFAAYINGMAIESKQLEFVGLKEFSTITKQAVTHLYAAVENPVEGTMITVIREWADYLFHNHEKFESFQSLLHEAYLIAIHSLEKTTEKLEILKKNNLVDSGAAGFVQFLKGINSFFSGETISSPITETPETSSNITLSIDSQIDLLYRYCTEVTIENIVDMKIIKDLLADYGDSLIVSSHGNRTKIHLHTNNPEKSIWKLRSLGRLSDQKVDDMKLQNQERIGAIGKIGILTDSIADLPEQYCLDNNINVIPVGLLIEESDFLDKLTISLPQLFNYLREQKLSDTALYPSSSQPEPSRIRMKLERMADIYESIIVISVSSKLSGTYNSFSSEAKRLSLSGKKISVVDSALNSGAEGLLVKAAAEMLRNGSTHEETVKEIEMLKKQTKIYVCLETIENAVRSGRVPDTVGKIGKLIGARPIMTLDQTGAGSAFGVGFSVQGMTKKIFKLLKKAQRENGIKSYSIVHADNIALAEEYGEKLTALLGRAPEFITMISSVTAIHSGKGSVAVSFITEK